ncbi:MAG: ABC transporter permease [Rubrivivax sp.]|nr:ABC transporter permease [Rubrivivax sp.]MDH5340848.1 ABC transporter permease [Rubrivivax sp.]
MSETWDLLLAAPFWGSVLRIATPLILGTLGVLLCERAGVLNLGIEGIMVAGAFSGWWAVYQGAGLWTGVAVAAGVGGAFGLLHALLTVGLALSQHVSGLGITLLATSLASYAYRVGFPKVDSPPTIEPFAPWPALLDQTPLTLAALLLVPVIGYALYRTPAGLALRMVGENPAAAEGQGLSVAGVRTAAIVAGSALMGVAGAFLTLSAFNAFYFNMVNGRGWVCVALVVFASWRPGKALLGALLFAFFDALQLRLQQAGDGGLFGLSLPYQLYLMLPYAMAIVALVLVARRASYPQALMKPYRKGER